VLLNVKLILIGATNFGFSDVSILVVLNLLFFTTAYDFTICLLHKSPQVSLSHDNFCNIVTNNIATIIISKNDNIVQIRNGAFLLFFDTILLFRLTKNNHSHHTNSNQKNIIENICNRFTAVHPSIQKLSNLFGLLIKE
jgi:hypothetical protein